MLRISQVADMACVAAWEMDMLAQGADRGLDSVRGVLAYLVESVGTEATGDEPTFLLPGATRVVSRAIRSLVADDRSVDTVPECIQAAREKCAVITRVTQAADPTAYAVQHPDDVEAVKRLCVELTWSASATQPPREFHRRPRA